jgi:beta-glucosidase
MSAWLDRVPAVIEAWYPGQEGGTALAEILFGDTNPSGRLPVTFERLWEDNPVHDSYHPAPGSNRVDYKEGIFLGYRGYEHNKTRPLFPFGYGLSYTSFKYGNLKIREVSPGKKYEVSFDVANTGSRAGAEVSQIYIGDSHSGVPRPAKELKGLAKTELRPGQTKRVVVILDERAFSYYDAKAKQWCTEPGKFDVLVGRSSEQIELQGDVSIK